MLSEIDAGAVREAVEAVRVAREEFENAKFRRDMTVRIAFSFGASATELAALTGMARSRIYQIESSAKNMETKTMEAFDAQVKLRELIAQIQPSVTTRAKEIVFEVRDEMTGEPAERIRARLKERLEAEFAIYNSKEINDARLAELSVAIQNGTLVS